jgi:hypothetical protein
MGSLSPKLISQVMGRSMSSLQRSEEGGSICRTFDLSTLDGWSSAAKCFSLHSAGVVLCTCVQAHVPVGSTGGKRYKTMLSCGQLKDSSAAAQFCGEMKEHGQLKITFQPAGVALATGDSASSTTAEMGEQLFNCVFQQMEGSCVLSITRCSCLETECGDESAL